MFRGLVGEYLFGEYLPGDCDLLIGEPDELLCEYIDAGVSTSFLFFLELLPNPLIVFRNDIVYGLICEKI